MNSRIVHGDKPKDPHELSESCYEDEDQRRALNESEMIPNEVLDKIRDRMETALGHDNFEIHEKDFRSLGNKKIVDADVNIFFTDRVLQKRFIIYDGEVVGVKDRNT